jgi:hypothetical protein
MAYCNSCGHQLAFSETVKSLGGGKRCNQCNMKFNQIKYYWLGAIQQQFNQGGVSAEFEQTLYRSLQEVRMPPDFGQPIVQQVQYLRNITETNRLNQIKDRWLSNYSARVRSRWRFCRSGTANQAKFPRSSNAASLGSTSDTAASIFAQSLRNSMGQCASHSR